MGQRGWEGSATYARKRVPPFLPPDPEDMFQPRPHKVRILPYLGGSCISYRLLPDAELAASLPAFVAPASDEPAARAQGMEKVSLPAPAREPAPLHGLGLDIVVMILEELRDLDPDRVAGIRLASRLFDEIGTPIFYHSITLGRGLVAPGAEAAQARALRHVYAHTKHVTIPSNFHPDGVRRLLERTGGLASVTWRYIRHAPCWMPSDYLDSLQPPPRVELHVERLPVQFIPDSSWDAYAIPADKLVSLKMREPMALQPRRICAVKELLLRARGLRTFHYEDGGQGRQFLFDPGDRLPPLRELRLRCYDWQHSREETSAHWDFSGLRSLELSSVPLYNFLSSVALADLAHLHTLRAEDAAARASGDKRAGATEFLHTLVRDRIRALTTLEIVGCHIRRFSLSAVLAHAETLESLCLRDYIGFEEDGRRCPTLSTDEVRLLAGRLVRLRALELDMDLPAADAPPFLEALCAFPRVHTLTLHVQTALRPLGEAPGARLGDDDPDHDAALATFRLLLGGRAGWRSVTLKVGGWRRVGVRRLGHAWRQMNARGRYAERCFVLDRDDAGRIQVREEDMMAEPEVVRNAAAAAAARQ